MRTELTSWWSEHAPHLPADALQSVMAAALLAGIVDVAAEAALPEVPNLREVSASSMIPCAADDPEFAFDLPPEEAIDYWLDQRIVSPEEFAALDDAARAHAFTATRLADERVLSETYIRLDRAIESGQTQNEWLDGMESMLDAMGVGNTSTHYLRFVFDQNVATSYGAGRWTQMMAVAEERPYWQYHAMRDGSERPEHAALDGVVKPAGDPFWQRYYPPWDYGCRCWVTTHDADELADAGLAVTTDDEIRETYENSVGALSAEAIASGGMPPVANPQLSPARYFEVSQMEAQAEGR